jgi:Holliday junction resolvase RusA-like endonuclease
VREIVQKTDLGTCIASFEVPGDPAPGGSKRAFRRGRRIVVTDDCKRNKAWRATVALYARAAFRRPASRNPLRVTATFFIRRPRSHYGTGRNASVVRASAPPMPTSKPDATKLWRSTEDALTGIIWVDDAQIVEQTVAKQYAATPGAMIKVCEVG